MRFRASPRETRFSGNNYFHVLVLLQLLVFHFSVTTTKSSQFQEADEGGREEDSPIGYGYEIRSVAGNASGKLLTAYLQLIRNTSVFGPDIQSLSLIARLVNHTYHSFFCH